MIEQAFTSDLETAMSSPSTNIPKLADEYTGFLFLPSFRESIDSLAKADKELSMELLWEIVVYGTEHKEQSDNPIIQSIMQSIKRTIDAGGERRAKKLEKEGKRG